MGLLLDILAGRLLALPARALVGRGPHCALQVADPRVSAEHAVLAWNGEAWTLRDLSSRNGTWLDGVAVPPGADHPVRAGAELRVADRLFRLVDPGAPAPSATDAATGGLRTTAGHVLLLPDDDHPELAVFADPAGGWICEDAAGPRHLGDGERVQVGGRTWVVHLPVVVEPTLRASPPVELRLVVSSDEEHASAEVRCGSATASLRPRSHLYLLVVLARARLAAADAPADDRGWLRRDDLARMLRCDPITVNVQIHRLRHDLGQLPFEEAQSLVEVRPRTGLIRLGTDRVGIARLPT